MMRAPPPNGSRDASGRSRSGARRWCAPRIAAGIAILACAAPAPAGSYADRAGTDIVMDAPWRSIRNEIPVLFFFPQFEGGRRVECLRIVELTGGGERTVFADHANGADTLNGATLVGPLGESRGDLTSGELVSNFWHCVVRLPHAALAAHGDPDLHFLRAEVDWTSPGVLGRRAHRNDRVLRVVVDPTPFPKFDAGDLYLDTHVHTIAEQTTSGVLDVNGASKAFGGPVVMLLESAYALGLVETPLASGNWSAFRDRIAVTDHNIFHSREPYDTGAAPRFGPTASTDGHGGEAAWYRASLGRLAGEEITLRRGSNQDGSATPNLGHHLLAYGGPHVEGPWHGGWFLTSSLENPNTLESVLRSMRSTPGSFVYASHPNLAGFVWPPEYWSQAGALPPHHSVRSAAVDSANGEFLFRGAEVWNIKMDEIARDSGRLPASSAFDHLNPFAGGPAAQRFRRVSWDGELHESVDTLMGWIGRGLDFAFREAPDERFIRKLYLSAGSDAHGDFNYADEVSATAVPWSGYLHSNAFARVRTYVLTRDRTGPAADPVEAFREGSTAITDGPILSWQLDGDGRHDPGAGAARWHDAESRWQNGDGRIGGTGRFDGGGTLLAVVPATDAWIRSEWRKSVSPGAGDVTALRFDRVTASGRDSFVVAAGAAGSAETRAVPVALDRTCALLATARDLESGERCITNPAWVAPVRIQIASDSFPPRPGIAYPAGTLHIAFEFPFTMSAAPATRAFLRPLDGQGVSTDPEIELQPDPGWERWGSIARSRLRVTNAADVPLPPAEWNAASHAAAPGVRSFVVYLTSPTDVHGNVLNDIARAFTCPVPEAGSGGRRKP